MNGLFSCPCRDAVCSSLERRNIDINQVDIFLASSNTALPLQVDCFPLGGNHLHVKGKYLCMCEGQGLAYYNICMFNDCQQFRPTTEGVGKHNNW